jgi:hypothetical protein
MAPLEWQGNRLESNLGILGVSRIVSCQTEDTKSISEWQANDFKFGFVFL